MNSGQIRIEKVSLRLRGVSAEQGRRRASSMVNQIAQAIARESAGAAGGKSGLEQLSLRLPAAGAAADLGEQISRQWKRE